MNDISIQLHKERLLNIRDERYIRASSIGMCRRRIGYSVLGYQPTPEDSHSLFTFDLGHAIHFMIQSKLVSMGWIKAKPTFNKDNSIAWKQTSDKLSGCELQILDHDLRIMGHCDGVTVPLVKSTNEEGITTYIPNKSGERYLIEIKSITDKSRFWVLGIPDGGKEPITDINSGFIDIDPDNFNGKIQQRVAKFQYTRKVTTKHSTIDYPVYKLKVNGKDELVTVLMIGNSVGSFTSLQSPKANHIAQASLYASYLNIDKILFIYVGKDSDSKNYQDDNILNLPIKIIEHKVDSTDVLAIKQKIKDVYSYTDKTELPPRDFKWEEDRSECTFCPYNWQCYPDKINIDVIKNKISKVGIHNLVEGPNIKHISSSNIQ